MKTQVAIIGAGPSGLMLNRYLALHGIESIVIEDRSRDYVEARIRAGLLEKQTVELLDEIGVGERLHREGMEHEGVYLQIPGERKNINFKDLIGYSVWVYGQTEVQKDLDHACDAAGQQIFYEAKDVLRLPSWTPTAMPSKSMPQLLQAAMVSGVLPARQFQTLKRVASSASTLTPGLV
jgi:p-hydroxybenzoate 3-monooxygenase